MQGSQVMNTPSTPTPTSPAIPAKITEHSKYCAICTPLGKDCPEKIAMSSDWDEEEGNTKEKDQEQPHASPNFCKTLTKTLQPPKPYVTRYFDSMTRNTLIIYTSKEKQRHNAIVAQQELNTTQCKTLDQDLPEDMG